MLIHPYFVESGSQRFVAPCEEEVSEDVICSSELMCDGLGSSGL